MRSLHVKANGRNISVLHKFGDPVVIRCNMLDGVSSDLKKSFYTTYFAVLIAFCFLSDLNFSQPAGVLK